MKSTCGYFSSTQLQPQHRYCFTFSATLQKHPERFPHSGTHPDAFSPLPSMHCIFPRHRAVADAGVVRLVSTALGAGDRVSEQRVSASVYVSRSPSTGGKYPPFPGSGNRTEALHICPDLVQLIAEISGNRRSNIVEAFDKQRRKLHNQQIEKRIIHTCWKRNRSAFQSPCFPLLPVPSAKRGDEYETDGI